MGFYFGMFFLFLQGGFVICELRIKRFFVIYGFVVSLGIKICLWQ